MEMWKPVLGYEGLYEVSDRGNVRGLLRSYKPRLRGDLLTPGLSSGKLTVALYNRNDEPRRKTRLVHHLVLEAFAEPRPPGHEGCHGPGGPLDNRWPENVYWATPSQNQQDRVRDGTSNRGERQWQSKLTAEIVTECRRRYAVGETQRALAAEFGVTGPTMSNAVTGETWTWLPDAVRTDMSRVGKRGSDHHAAKLMWDQVDAIRRRAAAGETQRSLAAEFGVSQPVVSKIVRGETWR